MPAKPPAADQAAGRHHRESAATGQAVGDDVADLPADRKIALTGGADFWHTADIPELGLPAIQLSDGPHGLRAQTADADNLGLSDALPATCFPPAVGLAATWSRDTAAQVAGAIADEARTYGISVVLGPGMNIKRSPLGGRNFEYFSEDPHLAGELATAYVNGLQAKGVGASVKHFALNNQETDRMRVDVDVDERTMYEIYLRAFRTVVMQARPWTVMCSYNSVAGTPVASNRFLLNDVLRGQWGFEGAVVSDWGAVTDRAASVAAGLDLQMPADPSGEADLRAALSSGSVELTALDRAAGAVAGLIAKGTAAARSTTEEAKGTETNPATTTGQRTETNSGTETNPATAPSSESVPTLSPATREEHDEVARLAAQRAIVLLQNDGLLPLDPAESGLAVIGHFAATPRYQGGGSSHVNATRLSTARDAITAYAQAPVAYAQGYAPDAGDEGNATLRHQAVEVARSAGTVVLFLGLDDDVESEGFDRTDLELPAAQIRLVTEIRAVNPSVVIVLSNGSAVRLPGVVREQPAVLESWLLGQAGGQAVADVLFGLANPSGKLPESLPLRLADLPSTLHFPGEKSRVRYGEGLFVGYRGLDAAGANIAYPFGHGLSYTTFAYSDLALHGGGRDEPVRAELTVRNTGQVTGREVVQAYVSVPGSAVTRPVRELKGFGDVELAPGESARLAIDIPYAELAYWDVDVHDWVVETATYTVQLASSSRDVRLTASVAVTGNESTPALTERTTLAELLAVPGAAELLAGLVGGTAQSEGAANAATGPTGEAVAPAAAPSPGADSGQSPNIDDLLSPEMLAIAGQIPVGRFTGLGGLTREQVDGLLAAVNSLA